MIVMLSRDRFSFFVSPHHSDCEAMWLSPGAYRYLLAHTGYRVFEMERVSEYLTKRMRETGHLRPLCDAPPLGDFTEDFEP